MTEKASYKWYMLSAIFLLVTLINLDYIAVNMALVEISKDIEPDLNKVQWFLSGYVLAWSACCIPAGKLADLWGQRRMLISGVCVFTLSSFLCGLAPTTTYLIMGRALQGIGGAMFVPSCYALIMNIFDEKQQGLAIGILGVSAGVGLSIGPTFGGLITDILGWRYIFYSMLPFGVIALIVFIKLLPKETPPAHKKTFDIIGALLLMASMIVTMYTLNQIEVWGIADPRFLKMLGMGLLFFGLFLWRSIKTDVPLLPRVIFQNKGYNVLLGAFFISCFYFTLITVLFGLYLQNIQGLTPIQGSYCFLAFTITFGALSPYVGKLYPRFGGKRLILISFIVLFICFISGAFLKAQPSIWLAMLVLFIAGVGLGINFPTANTGMLKNAHKDHLNTSSALFAMLSTLGCSFGVIFASSAIVGMSKLRITGELATPNHALSSYGEDILALNAQAHRSFHSTPSAKLHEIVAFLDAHFMESFSMIMLFCAIIALLYCFIVMKMMTKEH